MLCLYSLHFSEVKTAPPLRVYKAQSNSSPIWDGQALNESLWTLNHRGDSESGLESAFYTISEVNSRSQEKRWNGERGWFEAGKKKKRDDNGEEEAGDTGRSAASSF